MEAGRKWDVQIASATVSWPPFVLALTAKIVWRRERAWGRMRETRQRITRKPNHTFEVSRESGLPGLDEAPVS